MLSCRDVQDKFAAASHRKAAAAAAAGKFKQEIVPVHTKVVDPKTGSEHKVCRSFKLCMASCSDGLLFQCAKQLVVSQTAYGATAVFCLQVVTAEMMASGRAPLTTSLAGLLARLCRHATRLPAGS